jgi:hypothetical protein
LSAFGLGAATDEVRHRVQRGDGDGRRRRLEAGSNVLTLRRCGISGPAQKSGCPAVVGLLPARVARWKHARDVEIWCNFVGRRTRVGTVVRAMRRLAVVLAAFGLAGCREDDTKFDAAVFRDAAAREDEDQLNRQAYAAERQQALVGLSRDRVHALLGRKPDEVWRETHSDAWDVGLVNDAMGPGDQGYLAVEYDPMWRRVIRVEVVY